MKSVVALSCLAVAVCCLFEMSDAAPEQPHIMLRVEGRRIRLQCGGRSNSSVSYSWRFKSCGPSYSFISCQYVSEPPDSWPEANNPTARHGALVLNYATERDSGLYRCIVSVGGKSFVARQYQLEVIALGSEPPTLLDQLPANVTVFEPLSAVLECKVLSTVPPYIGWARKVESFHRNGSHYVHYFNETYEMLGPSGVLALSDQVYLSKLILPTTSTFDSGTYVCLAVNHGGLRYKGAYLSVLPTVYDVDYHQSKGSGSLFLLFLIPASLVVVPLVIWLCCVYRRKFAAQDVPSESPVQVGYYDYPSQYWEMGRTDVFCKEQHSWTEHACCPSHVSSYLNSVSN